MQHMGVLSTRPMRSFIQLLFFPGCCCLWAARGHGLNGVQSIRGPDNTPGPRGSFCLLNRHEDVRSSAAASAVPRTIYAPDCVFRFFFSPAELLPKSTPFRCPGGAADGAAGKALFLAFE